MNHHGYCHHLVMLIIAFNKNCLACKLKKRIELSLNLLGMTEVNETGILKEILNSDSDDQQFHLYQQNKQSPISSNHLTSKKKTMTHSVEI